MTDQQKKPKKISIEQVPFVGVLLLFAGFSLYGILSFNSSIDDYVDTMQASVLNSSLVADGGTLIDEWELLTLEATSGGEIFSDVAVNHSNATAIAYFKQMGWIQGYDDGSFKPDQLVNRAELLTILTNVIDADFTGGVYENCFTDVKNEWFAVFVCYAEEQGWIGGYPDGSYKPGQTVVKAEALKIALLAMSVAVPESVTEKPYDDVNISDWYAPYAYVAKIGNIVSGSVFNASENMTRSSFVQMVYNTLLYSGQL